MPEQLSPGLQRLLKTVSRSFYLTIRVLPAAIRPQIGLAYLLARAGDTIADACSADAASRRGALAALRAAARRTVEGSPGECGADIAIALSFQGIASAAERLLLESIDAVLRVLGRLPESDRLLVGAVLDTIMTGQDSDIVRFGSASSARIAAIDTDADLDFYTYSVAGCVGEFWTHMCRSHLFPSTVLDDTELLADGVRFGKGLQLVNILRDLAADLRKGRCYIPGERLRRLGVTPESLMEPSAMDCFRPLYDEYLQLAHAHLAAGWRYAAAIPPKQLRVRLACAWPALIGARTLALLGSRNALDPDSRVKVSRREVRRLMLGSVVRYRNRPAWDRLFDQAARSELARS